MMPERVHTSEDFIMDTVVEQRVFGDDSRSACERTVSLLRGIEEKMSFFLPGSEIYMLNESAGTGIPVRLSPEVFLVLKTALEISVKSGGAFDVTSAPLSQYWRKAGAGKTGAVSGKEEFTGIMSLTGYDKVRLFPDDSAALLEEKGCAVDLGGIAKGFAADIAIALYEKMGIKSALINLGGNVRTLGEKPDGSPWVIGLQHPDEERGTFFGALKVRDMSVVTSGGYERYYLVGNKKYHHIMDTKTGHPALSGLLSATVVYPESMLADALSTACFVLGLARAKALLDMYPGTEAVFMDEEKHVWITPGLRESYIPAPAYDQLVINEYQTG